VSEIFNLSESDEVLEVKCDVNTGEPFPELPDKDLDEAQKLAYYCARSIFQMGSKELSAAIYASALVDSLGESAVTETLSSVVLALMDMQGKGKPLLSVKILLVPVWGDYASEDIAQNGKSDIQTEVFIVPGEKFEKKPNPTKPNLPTPMIVMKDQNSRC
jgi:hypothetical protein